MTLAPSQPPKLDPPCWSALRRSARHHLVLFLRPEPLGQERPSQRRVRPSQEQSERLGKKSQACCSAEGRPARQAVSGAVREVGKEPQACCSAEGRPARLG